ncbi:MAG: CapA family protein [Synergistaceae bacterium]|nr:CapA family protein [Synergistaceae bacterium]MBP9958079.1 CapA family protein [Synergistaceae bacterium]
MTRYKKTAYSLGALLVVLLFSSPFIRNAVLATPSPPIQIQPVEMVRMDETPIRRARLFFVGDIMAHRPQVNAARYFGGVSYDFTPQFKEILPLLSGADLLVGNLETVLGGAKTDADYTGYPLFNTPDSLLDALKNAGFDVLLLANNHANDKKPQGLLRTLEEIKKRGFLWAGVDDPQEGRSPVPLLMEVQGIQMALLNYTYGSNTALPSKGAQLRPSLMDEAQILKDIAAARDKSADIVVVCLHWGNEYALKSSDAQRVLASKLQEAGADIIIGSHPHVVQPIEMAVSSADGRPQLVAWSLGNFVSNQRPIPRERTMLLSVEITKKEGESRVSRVAVAPLWVQNMRKPHGFMRILHADETNPKLLSLNPADRNKLLEAGAWVKRALGLAAASRDEQGFYTLWESSPDVFN